MKSKTELDERFEFGDSKELTRDIKVLALIIFTMLCFFSTLFLVIFGRLGMWDAI